MREMSPIVPQVCFLILIVFMVLGTLTVQLFAGALSQECVDGPAALSDNFIVSEPNGSDSQVGSSAELLSEQSCLVSSLSCQHCAKIQLGPWLNTTWEREDAVDLYGFDDVFQASATLFIMMTLDECSTHFGSICLVPIFPCVTALCIV